MKKLLVTLILALPFYAFSQSAKDEVKLYQDIWGLEKKALVSAQMQFSKTEEAAFWPVYDNYEVARKKLGFERIQIIADYASVYGNISPAQADNLASRTLANDKAFISLEKSYYSKFKKAIGSVRALQFLQLEYYFQTAIRSTVQGQIPLIDQTDDKELK